MSQQVPVRNSESRSPLCQTKWHSISWFPVVFTFSFTSRELQTQPLTQLRARFEQLDIKLLTDYHTTLTTHVVSKKRNTAKGLQALINGKYVVTETFLDAVVHAAETPQGADDSDSSALELDFDQQWPDAMQHLPPPGGEPVQHPDSAYAPDLARKDIFEGYTFVFYEQAQYNNLLAPITNGGGKAVFETVTPDRTTVDDFVRFAKSVAGEKGLGSFEDGSEGRGVVLVRYIPAKGEHVAWYTDFFTGVSLELDHRPIEQSEFLEAILIRDASILRRPLQIESSSQVPESQVAGGSRPESASAVQSLDNEPARGGTQAQSVQSQEPESSSRRSRMRGPVKRRFAGFDDDDDIDMDESFSGHVSGRGEPPEEEGGLFVSQEVPPGDNNDPENGRTSQRKRRISSLPEDDLMEGIAPAVARFKRQRIERGDDFASADQDMTSDIASARPEPKKKVKKEIDVLAVAAQHRREEEARAQAEKDDLAYFPGDVDLSEIRRLNIVEEMEVVRAPQGARTRDQDVADGRWNPNWNGMKNFKKFRRRGEATGRQPARVIVSLVEVKNKEFGIGDDYWLEQETSQRKKTAGRPPQSEAQSSTPREPPKQPKRVIGVVVSDSSDENEDDDDSAMPEISQLAASHNTRRSGTQSRLPPESQLSKPTSQGRGKRAAAEPVREQPAKRQRPTRNTTEVADSDDSDDELKFRFGKRR